MKSLTLFATLFIFGSSWAQTEMLNINPDITEEVQNTIAQDNFSEERQEQQEDLFERDLTYEEAREIYRDEVVNGYDALDPDDEGIVY